MLFQLLVTTFMLVQLAGANRNGKSLIEGTFGVIQADADQHLYLASVSHEAPLKAVLLGEAADTFEPIYNHVAIGYVINRTTTPVYSVTLLLTFRRYFSNYPYDTITTTFSPFFSTTLPGQVNPFYFYTSNSNHVWIRFDDVRIINQAGPASNDPTYVGLDASQWITGGQDNLGDHPRITGTVRNTSQVPVHDARVVIMYMPTGTVNSVCSWVQAALLTTTLQPGEATEYYARYCGIGTPLPVAQGMVSP